MYTDVYSRIICIPEITMFPSLVGQCNEWNLDRMKQIIINLQTHSNDFILCIVGIVFQFSIWCDFTGKLTSAHT